MTIVEVPEAACAPRQGILVPPYRHHAAVTCGVDRGVAGEALSRDGDGLVRHCGGGRSFKYRPGDGDLLDVALAVGRHLDLIDAGRRGGPDLNAEARAAAVYGRRAEYLLSDARYCDRIGRDGTVRPVHEGNLDLIANGCRRGGNDQQALDLEFNPVGYLRRFIPVFGIEPVSLAGDKGRDGHSERSLEGIVAGYGHAHQCLAIAVCVIQIDSGRSAILEPLANNGQ